MKIKNNFILRQVAGSWIAMPVGEASANIEGVLSLNESGVLLWQCLVQGCDYDKLSRVLVDEYGIDSCQAKQDACAFVEKLRKFDCIE